MPQSSGRIKYAFGLLLILVAAVAFFSRSTRWIQWLSMFPLLAGVFMIRSASRSNISMSKSSLVPLVKRSIFPLPGLIIMGTTFLSFFWLFISPLAGRYAVVDVWLCAIMTMLLIGYLFYYFIIRR